MTVRNKGVKTQRTSGGLGIKNNNPRKLGAMVMNAIAVSGGLQLGTAYTLESPSDILSILKVDAAYDDANTLLVYEHLNSFFTRNPGGTLHVLFAPQKVSTTHITPAVMCDKDEQYLKKLLDYVKTKVKAGQLVSVAVAFNPAADYTATIADGLDNTLPTAIAEMQATFDVFADDYLFCNGWLEGRAFSGTVSALADLRDLAEEAPRVSVVLAADPRVMALDARYEDYAAVGDVLGLDTLAPVSQNIGELDEARTFDLLSVADNRFVTPGLSGDNDSNTLTNDQKNDLDAKGYVFAEVIAGYDGVYLNDTHTCTLITNDYSYKENNYVVDLALLFQRSKLLPLTTNSRLRIDSTTGELEAGNKAMITDAAERAILENMPAEISGGVASKIPAGQNLLAGEELIIESTFVPFAIGRKVTVKSGFSNPLNA